MNRIPTFKSLSSLATGLRPGRVLHWAARPRFRRASGGSKLFTALGALCLFTFFTFYTQPAWSQSDNLVSKGTGMLFTSEDQAWLFDENNLSYSQINFFTSPPEIYAFEREENALTGGFLTAETVVGHPLDERQDSTRTVKLIQFSLDDPDDEREIFNMIVPDLGESDGVSIRDALEAGDSLYLALGVGGLGLSLIENRVSTGEITLAASFQLWKWTDSSNTLNSDSCRNNDLCPASVFEPESGTSLASVDVVESVPGPGGSAIVLAGSGGSTPGRGLWRWVPGEDTLSAVTSENLHRQPIQKIDRNPANGLVWVFTEDGYYVSSDSGQTFSTPAGISNDKVISLREPRLAFSGDTTLINFDFSGRRPGVVYFEGNTLLTNDGEDPGTFEYFLDPRLEIARSLELGALGAVRRSGSRAFVAGTKTQGLYYLLEGEAVEEEVWLNINRQTPVEKNLKEVITFPTMYNGTDDVGIGYQLEKSARVTITVYNYAMEKVRTLVNNRPRTGGASRSENPEEDRWDGRDNNGELVSAGLYYIEVSSDKGETGWGKAMVLIGR